MRQIIWRSLWRALLRVELWNSNRERWGNLLARDPHNSVVVWAWQRHTVYRNRFAAAASDPAWANLRFVRLGSRTDASHMLNQITLPPRP